MVCPFESGLSIYPVRIRTLADMTLEVRAHRRDVTKRCHPSQFPAGDSSATHVIRQYTGSYAMHPAYLRFSCIRVFVSRVGAETRSQ